METGHETVTQVLGALVRGERLAAAELLPLVYAELKRIARAQFGRLAAGQTLQPTALVHEAYLKLVGGADPGWDGRNHFFVAAAQAMREILIDQARRKAALKRGGDRKRIDADVADLAIASPTIDLLALDEALTRLEQHDPRQAKIVMLRYFAGLGREEIAELLGVTTRTIDREWRYIIARLHRDLAGGVPRGADDPDHDA